MSGRVAYAIDRNYLMPLAVSLRSLADTLRPGIGVEVFVLHSELTEQDKARVSSALSPDSKVSLRWLAVDESEVKSLRAELHFSSANYFRLLLPELLPADVEQVLYLDSDTILRSDITELLQLFDPAFPLQACLDYSGSLGNPLIRLADPSAFGLAADAPYFNSGVLLMNLKQWRTERISRKILEFSSRNPQALWFVDQTPINIVLHGQIGMLPAHWNAQTVHPNVLNGEWNVPYLPQDLDSARLVHYTSEVKPWSIGKGTAAARYFEEVKARIGWE
jgi:lipopolysaccharide biosynthesis glycosyltransferase